LYDLWEAWKKTAKLTKAVQDSIVTGDPAGETTAALTFARGGKTHDLIEFGAFTDTFSDTFTRTMGSGVGRRTATSDQNMPAGSSGMQQGFAAKKSCRHFDAHWPAYASDQSFKLEIARDMRAVAASP